MAGVYSVYLRKLSASWNESRGFLLLFVSRVLRDWPVPKSYLPEMNMPKRIAVLSFVAVLLACAAAYKHLPPLFTEDAAPLQEAASSSTATPSGEPGTFHRVRRAGSVNLNDAYDLSGLTIPEQDIHTLLPRDAIPALTDPKTKPASESDWLDDTDRVILIEINQQRYGVPLNILDWHEIVNTTVGGEPIAVTYCPLCDSATVFSRRITPAGGDGEPIVLAFGVSGALYNSNVLMYDRTHKGLWSQLGMVAVSGPLAGTSLDMLPVQVVEFEQINATWPQTPIVSPDTGHDRPYGRSAYASYFSDDQLMVPVREHGDALPAKTLGIGIALEGEAWFVPADAIGDQGVTITTDKASIEVRSNPAGVELTRAPATTRCAQTFYYAWSAFYPHAKVLASADSKPSK